MNTVFLNRPRKLRHKVFVQAESDCQSSPVRKWSHFELENWDSFLIEEVFETLQLFMKNLPSVEIRNRRPRHV